MYDFYTKPDCAAENEDLCLTEGNAQLQHPLLQILPGWDVWDCLHKSQQLCHMCQAKKAFIVESTCQEPHSGLGGKELDPGYCLAFIVLHAQSPSTLCVIVLVCFKTLMVTCNLHNCSNLTEHFLV